MTAALAAPAAGTRITIAVTQEHIDRGRPCHTGECALAMAITDIFPAAPGDICVSPDPDTRTAYARVWLGLSSWVTLRLGEDAREFMTSFDCGLPVAPASFTAEVA